MKRSFFLFLLLVLPTLLSAQTTVDQGVQASFFNKVFSIMDDVPSDHITILYDDNYVESAKMLRNKLESYLYTVTLLSEKNISPEYTTSILFVFMQDSKIPVEISQRSNIIISQQLDDVMSGTALFNLSKDNNRLKLFVSSKFIISHKMSVDKRILNIAKLY